VVDNDGLKAFVNSLTPGACKSVSSIDFAALNAHQLELIGIYGSKGEIVRFLVANGRIDDATYVLLLYCLFSFLFCLPAPHS